MCSHSIHHNVFTCADKYISFLSDEGPRFESQQWKIDWAKSQQFSCSYYIDTFSHDNIYFKGDVYDQV